MNRTPDYRVIKDLLSDIVDTIRASATITSTVDNGDGTFTINTQVSNFKLYGRTLLSADLSEGDYITIDSTSYKISNLTSSSFDITIGAAPSGTWTALAPYYYNGTPIRTGNIDRRELTDENLMKYPFVATFEPIQSIDNWSDSTDDFENISLWMVFMTECNNADWSVDDHYTNAINPMHKLYMDFVYACKVNKYIMSEDIGEVARTNHMNWGLVAKFSGHTSNVFNESLSGVEIDTLNLKIRKTYENC